MQLQVSKPSEYDQSTLSVCLLHHKNDNVLVETNYPNFDAPSTTRTESSPTENSDKSDDEPTFLLEFGSDFENSQK